MPAKKAARAAPGKKRKTSADPERLELEVTTAELGMFLDVHPDTVSRWAKQEGMPKVRHGWFNLREAVQWYTRTLLTKGDRDALIKEQTERTRLQNQMTRREIVTAQEHSHLAGTLASMMANSLDGLGPRLANQLSSEADPRRITEIITDECRHIRARLAATVKDHADQYGSLAAGGEDPDSPA